MTHQIEQTRRSGSGKCYGMSSCSMVTNTTNPTIRTGNALVTSDKQWNNSSNASCVKHHCLVHYLKCTNWKRTIWNASSVSCPRAALLSAIRFGAPQKSLCCSCVSTVIGNNLVESNAPHHDTPQQHEWPSNRHRLHVCVYRRSNSSATQLLAELANPAARRRMPGTLLNANNQAVNTTARHGCGGKARSIYEMARFCQSTGVTAVAQLQYSIVLHREWLNTILISRANCIWKHASAETSTSTEIEVVSTVPNWSYYCTVRHSLLYRCSTAHPSPNSSFPAYPTSAWFCIVPYSIATVLYLSRALGLPWSEPTNQQPISRLVFLERRYPCNNIKYIWCCHRHVNGAFDYSTFYSERGTTIKPSLTSAMQDHVQLCRQRQLTTQTGNRRHVDMCEIVECWTTNESVLRKYS